MPQLSLNKLPELALTRRKLFEKIMQHVANRKIQNSIQATGDRMSVTPQQFGMQLGQQVKKSSFAPGGGPQLGGLMDDLQHIGGSIFADSAAGRSPLGSVMQNFGRIQNMSRTFQNMPGMTTTGASGGGMQNQHDFFTNMKNVFSGMPKMPGMMGTGEAWRGIDMPGMPQMPKMPSMMGTGAAWNMNPMQNMPGMPTMPHGAGAPDFSMKLAQLAQKQSGLLPSLGFAGKAIKAVGKGIYNTPRSLKALAAGGAGGYYAGRQHGHQAGQEQGRNDAAKALADLIKEKMPAKKASVLPTLGGLLGGGLGGLAGGAGGGILGALGGGALGGAPGAGLGLFAGGAAGLGAGAHMGGNIGADIGRSFSKKKEKPESDEKEEKSEEKSEDSGDEEVKKSAARVLAQLQKNADLPLRNMAGHVARGVGAAAEKAGPAYGYGAKPQPMSGVAGVMQRGGNTLAKMPTAGVGLAPKMMGQNIANAAPSVAAAGNKLVASEKKLAPQATGGIPMFGMLPGLAGNLGRNLGGK